MLRPVQSRQDGTARRSHARHVGLATSETGILAARKLRYRISADDLAVRPQPGTWNTASSSMRSAVSLPPHTQPESSATSPGSR